MSQGKHARPTNHRKSRRLSLLLVLLGVALAVGGSAVASHTFGLFELDGNTVNNPSVAGEDWNDIYTGANGTNRVFYTDKVGTFEDIFTTGGSKDDLPVSSWRHTTGTVPDKDDLLHAFAASYPHPTVNGRQVLYFGADRYAVNGASELGFWFFQQDVGLKTDGTFAGSHSVGDILVLAEFTTGGKVNSVDIYRWVGGANPLTLVAKKTDCAETAVESGGCGVVNSASTTPAWDYQAKNQAAGPIPAGGLFEAGIDPYTLGLSQRCFSSFMAVSRASHTIDSTLKDFVLGNFDTCSSITVTKQTDPDKAAGDFTFTLNPDPNSVGVKTLQDDGSYTFASLAPGTYDLSESSLPAGWDLSSISCNGGSPVQNGSNVTLTVGQIQNISCTFTNTQRGQIIIKKLTEPAGATQGFRFTASYNAAGFSLSHNQTNTSDRLVPGTYSVAETVPDGWDLTSATCDDGSLVNAIGVDPGETVTCTFTNTQRGKVIIKKVTNPTGSSQEFAFTSSAITGGFTLTDGTQKASEWIVPGTYNAAETVPTGWDQTSATCDDGSPVNAISVQPGETVTCTFTNTQRGKAEVIKTTNGAPAVAGQWRFTLKGSGVDVTDSTDSSGNVDFDGATLTPNTDYTICEVDIPAGWTSVLSGYTPINPDAPLEDLGNCCVTFQVGPGQMLSFQVDNVSPRGDARTIGYWKNWNLCSGGRQGLTAAAKGMKTLEQYLPQLVGNLTVDSCAKGVNILSKSDLSGKNMSSDAAYNMAAQLLAAKLNLASAARSCAAVTTAVTDGQALLVRVGFNGTGSYLTAKSKSPDRALALSLAATLDSYNNNTLCP